MNILKTYDFIQERLKVKPITNRQLDKAQKEMMKFMKIPNPTFDDIKEGNVVHLYCEGVYFVYIVFDSMNLPDYFEGIDPIHRKEGEMLLIRYNQHSHSFTYRTIDGFKHYFPFNNATYSSKTAEIVDVYDAKINTEKIQSREILRKEWNAACRKIRNYPF